MYFLLNYFYMQITGEWEANFPRSFRFLTHLAFRIIFILFLKK